ncbi:MAG TPA: DUF433 domain-containing protein [Longimicrobium sp.]|jgi:hypothetical protein
MSTHFDRITINPAISHGEPSVRGLCYPVDMIRELLFAGMSHDQILAEYPDLVCEGHTRGWRAHATHPTMSDPLPPDSLDQRSIAMIWRKARTGARALPPNASATSKFSGGSNTGRELPKRWRKSLRWFG